MDRLISFVSLILALSMAVERVIEILKGFFQRWLGEKQNEQAEYIRCAEIHLLSVLIGTAIAALGHIDLFQTVTGSASKDPIPGYVTCGLLSAGGSAFWNHILDVLKAAKIQREVRARRALREALPNNSKWLPA